MDCATCKHGYLNADEVPCDTCTHNRAMVRDHWEKKCEHEAAVIKNGENYCPDCGEAV